MMDYTKLSRNSSLSLLRLLFLLIIAHLPVLLPALQTERLMDDSPETFAQGDATTATLTADGRVAPPYNRDMLAGIDADVVWDVTEFDGSLFIATGHEGKVFRWNEGELSLFHDFEDAGVYTLHAGRNHLYAAASPSGTIFELNAAGDITQSLNTGQRAVWDLLHTDDLLMAATGPDGRIVTIDDSGTTDTLVQIPNVTNVMDLAAEPSGESIIIATQGAGYLVRVTMDGEYQILFDAEQEEIRRVAVMEDGSIIGAVNGMRSPGAKLLQDAGANGSNGNKPQPVGFLVRIDSDGFVEELFASPLHPIHDIALLDDGRIILAAGENGQLIEIDAKGDAHSIGATPQKFVTRLALTEDGRILGGSGSNAALFTMNPSELGEGIYHSRVFDSKVSARWERIRAYFDGEIAVRYRYGNTAKPDDSWTEWTEPVTLDSVSQLPGEVSRFFQYRLDFDMKGMSWEEAPSLDWMRIFYTRRNQSPKVTEVKIDVPKQKNQPQFPPPSYIGRMERQPFSVPPLFEITWSAEDPDGDPLLYDVHLRELEDAQWTLLEEDIEAPLLPLPAQMLPSGNYRVKVTARDDRGEPQGRGLSAAKESELLLIDNDQPSIRLVSQTEVGDSIVIRVEAEDEHSLIASAAWREGLGDWNHLYAADQALDQEKEIFEFAIDGDSDVLYVTVMVTDEAGNTRLEKIVLE